MTVILQRILASDFPTWVEQSCAEYVGDLLAQGRSHEEARRIAVESMARSFPEGTQSPGNEVFHVMNEVGTAVGYLWIGQDVTTGARGLYDSLGYETTSVKMLKKLD